MYFVYCLRSKLKEKFHYYGYTRNLEVRIKYHNFGKVRTTKKYLPVELIGCKIFEKQDEALAFEKKIKKSAYQRRKFLKEIKIADKIHLPDCIVRETN